MNKILIQAGYASLRHRAFSYGITVPINFIDRLKPVRIFIIMSYNDYTIQNEETMVDEVVECLTDTFLNNIGS